MCASSSDKKGQACDSFFNMFHIRVETSSDCYETHATMISNA